MLEEISFVLPAHNEQDNISRVIDSCRDVAPSVARRYEVVVVNDGSTDRTKEVVEARSAEDPAVVLVNHETNLGFASALRDGFAAARYGHVFYTDGDGQYDLSDISLLLPHAEEYDFVVGYRAHRADPFIRTLNATAYNIALRILLRVPVRDVDCAFKLMKTEWLRSIEVSADSAFYSAELIRKAAKAGAKIREVPVRHFPRRFGEQSGANPLVIFRALRDMAAYLLLPRRRRLRK